MHQEEPASGSSGLQRCVIVALVVLVVISVQAGYFACHMTNAMENPRPEELSVETFGIEVVHVAYGNENVQDHRPQLRDLVMRNIQVMRGTILLGPNLASIVGFDPSPDLIKSLYIHLRVDTTDYFLIAAENSVLIWKPPLKRPPAVSKKSAAPAVAVSHVEAVDVKPVAVDVKPVAVDVKPVAVDVKHVDDAPDEKPLAMNVDVKPVEAVDVAHVED